MQRHQLLGRGARDLGAIARRQHVADRTAFDNQLLLHPVACPP